MGYFRDEVLKKQVLSKTFVKNSKAFVKNTASAQLC